MDNNQTAETAKNATTKRNEPFPDEMFTKIPEPLKSICDRIEEKHTRDMLLLSSLPVIASHIVNVFGNHRDGKYTPDFFVLIVAPPAAGKGILVKSKALGNSLQNAKFNEDHEKSTLFLPANTSSRAFYDTLNANNGRGLIFETEIDTLLNANKQEWGNFSDVTRKAFQHEPISINRKDMHYYIDNPCLSICLSGTLDQFLAMFPNAENGLFSRFAMYCPTPPINWRSHRPTENSSKIDHLISIADEKLYQLFALLSARDKPLHIELEEKHWDWVDHSGEKIMCLINELGIESYFHASNRRMPVITLRLIMIMAVLRVYSNDDGSLHKTPSLFASDEDVLIAIKMSEVLIRHSLFLYWRMRKEKYSIKLKDERMRNFYSALPSEFSTAEALTIGEKLEIPERTVSDWLNKFFEKIRHGYYRKKL